ncbi:MAG: HAD family hydrolase [Cyanobacteria bacterium P01_H01_bin.35]
MNFPNINRKTIVFFLSVMLSTFCLGSTLGCLPAHAAGEDYLSSWNQTETKQAIVDFVTKVTTPGNDYVEEQDRIAVFDNDGTLWSEKPLYFPIKFELEHRRLEHENFVDYTTDEYMEEAYKFVSGDKYDKQEDFDVRYLDLVYEPVIDLVNYLKANDFKVYICSGGDIDFVRSFSDQAYGIPPEQVIGTAVQTSFDGAFGGNVKRDTDFLAGMLLENKYSLEGLDNQELAQYNDREGKPVGIQNHIGKRPIIAVGNSSGDFEMFQYTDVGTDKSLIVLINHDDCEREYQYNYEAGSTEEKCIEDETTTLLSENKYDLPSGCRDGYHLEEVPKNESLDEAVKPERTNWIVVSMQNDFNTIFNGTISDNAPGCDVE